MSYQYWQEISFFLDDLDKERSAFEKSAMTQESLEQTREKMANILEALKSNFEQRMDKYHASLIIFPIVATIDEKMQGYDFSTTKVTWTPLQKDFYAAYNAGEIFFKNLDEILDNPNIPNIVYQVYYTMLKMGFRGKYRDSETQIKKYLEMLKDKIPVTAPSEKKALHPEPTSKAKRSNLKRWHLYTLPFAVAATAYVLLPLIAQF